MSLFHCSVEVNSEENCNVQVGVSGVTPVVQQDIDSSYTSSEVRKKHRRKHHKRRRHAGMQ